MRRGGGRALCGMREKRPSEERGAAWWEGVEHRGERESQHGFPSSAFSGDRDQRTSDEGASVLMSGPGLCGLCTLPALSCVSGNRRL